MANQKKKREENEQEELDRTLRDHSREDLLGQIEENRNLTGSTTWETLEEEYNDENQQHGRRTQAASPREQENLRGQSSGEEARRQGEQRNAREARTPDEEARARPAANPPRTTTGPITAPKFGSAGSGGAELEPGPEKD